MVFHPVSRFAEPVILLSIGKWEVSSMNHTCTCYIPIINAIKDSVDDFSRLIAGDWLIGEEALSYPLIAGLTADVAFSFSIGHILVVPISGTNIIESGRNKWFDDIFFGSLIGHF